MESVLVGLSGGVDSAVSVRLLKEQGYRVHGTYLAFCPESDPEPAARLAQALDIPFSVVEDRKGFEKKVVRPFVDAFCGGETPNPCVNCNRVMKIPALLREADRLGIEKVATGHYARVEKEAGRWCLYRGKDENKDQSYFLWKLTQRQLSRLIFPLSGWEKQKARALAQDLLPQNEKESMEICFVPNGDTAGFVDKVGGQTPPGDFVDRGGRVLGQHRGISHYTIGQRRGLGVAMGERWFVTKLLPEKNQVVLGPEEELYCQEMWVESLHFVSVPKKAAPVEGICVQGRHRGKKIPCRVFWQEGGARVLFSDPCRRFAPGQSACFYLGDKLLFGGIIGKREFF